MSLAMGGSSVGMIETGIQVAVRMKHVLQATTRASHGYTEGWEIVHRTRTRTHHTHGEYGCTPHCKWRGVI